MKAAFPMMLSIAGLVLAGSAALAEDGGSAGAGNVLASGTRLQGSDLAVNQGPVWRGPVLTPDDASCRDRIIDVYGEDGVVQLDRRPASPDRPLEFYAVDHRVAGCGVLVLKDGRKQLPPAPRVEAQVAPAQ